MQPEHRIDNTSCGHYIASHQPSALSHQPCQTANPPGTCLDQTVNKTQSGRLKGLDQTIGLASSFVDGISIRFVSMLFSQCFAFE